jgi:hypothetical protein
MEYSKWWKSLSVYVSVDVCRQQHISIIYQSFSYSDMCPTCILYSRGSRFWNFLGHSLLKGQFFFSQNIKFISIKQNVKCIFQKYKFIWVKKHHFAYFIHNISYIGIISYGCIFYIDMLVFLKSTLNSEFFDVWYDWALTIFLFLYYVPLPRSHDLS